MIYAIVIALLASRGMDKYIAPLNISLSLLLLFYNKALSLGIIIISGPLMQIYATGFLQIFTFVPFLLYSFVVSITQRHNVGIHVLIAAVLYVSLSYLMGYKSDTTYYLLQIICMSMCYATYNVFQKEDLSIVIWAYICAAVMIIIYMSLVGIDNIIISGRLDLGEGSKSLALVCTTPIVIAIFSMISGKPIFENRQSLFYNILTISLIAVLLIALLATGARGILLGIGIGIILLFLKQGSSIKKYIVLFILLLVSYQLFNYVIELDLFRMERFFAFEEYGSGNGRTEIWGHYLRKISNMGSGTIMFGTGPGNISRISNIDAYAHSTFLDYFFSYGLFGFFGVFIFEFKSLKFLYHKENMIPFAIVVTLLLCYMTHGVASNTSFFMLQSLMMVYFKRRFREPYSRK